MPCRYMVCKMNYRAREVSFEIDHTAPKNPDGQPVMREVSRINLSAVYPNTKENDEFFRATPSGELKIGTVNDNAIAQLNKGGDHYVFIVPAAGFKDYHEARRALAAD